MADEVEKRKKKLRKLFDELSTEDEFSDIPIREKKVKEEEIKEI